MGLESTLARVAELRSVLAPRQAPPPATPPAGAPPAGGSFAQALAAAGAPGAAAAPPAGHGAALAGAPGRAAPGFYPHLSGDLDASPEILSRLEALAAARGERLHVTSGHRSHAEQQRLWDGRHSNPFPVAPPGRSRHHSGDAADVTIGGRPIQDVVPAAELRRHGLAPLAGDAVHVELAR